MTPVRRIALQLALWAAPLGLGLALVLLLAGAPYFRHGAIAEREPARRDETRDQQRHRSEPESPYNA